MPKYYSWGNLWFILLQQNHCNFSKTSNGVINADDLLAQYLVVMGASVFLYYLKFAIFGEVGETITRKYLKEKCNLFQSVEEVLYDVPPFWDIYHSILIKPSSFFVKTWCANTYKHYLQKQKEVKRLILQQTFWII